MRNFHSLFLQISILFIISFRQVIAQDSVVVQAFTWDNPSRNALFSFPAKSDGPFRRVWMSYNMRCHGAKVGVQGVGCGEWDYSCNTFITDSSKIDSIARYTDDYGISGFTGQFFDWTKIPTYTYYDYTQKLSTYTGTTSEVKATVGAGMDSAPFSADGGTYRGFYLFPATVLTGGGMSAGKLSGLDIQVAAGGAQLPHFRIRLAETALTKLDPLNPPVSTSWTEVYFKDTEFNSPGYQHLQFYQTFTWNGTANILCEVSFSKFNKAAEPKFMKFSIPDSLSIQAQSAEYSTVFDGISGEVQGGKLSQISDEITISFWSYGTAHLQPLNNSIIEGIDGMKNRSVNIHLPWSDGTVYWDCGNTGGNYDRIQKAVPIPDYEGRWSHWAFVKNATTGTMQIYLNGNLWHQVVGGNIRSIQLDKLRVGDAFTYTGPYAGRIRDVQVWNKALDAATIAQWRTKDLNNTHPNWNNLLYYWKMDEQGGVTCLDAANAPQHLQLNAPAGRHQERGHNMVKNWKSNGFGFNCKWVKGTYTGTQTENFTVLDSIANGPRVIKKYSVDGNNNLNLDSTFTLYAAGDALTYLENGQTGLPVYIEPEGSIAVSTLKYFERFPAKYELMSLVTPYGNNLDLGKQGKTFVFDITDYLPLLQGSKRISMELGGENQEEIDLKFIFEKGIPFREVLDVSNIWPFSRGYFADIVNNNVFEPRTLTMHPAGNYFATLQSVTGHEQNGEFTNKSHFLQVTGTSSKKFSFNVWKECAFNPIYPQGGTWIYDRAGWCPGAPTDQYRNDITSLVQAGQKATFDYGVNPPILTAANYLVSSQLFSYGTAAQMNDVAIIDIKRPRTGRVEYDRINPACNTPMISIQNVGSANLTICTIQYGVANKPKASFTWNGNLATMAKTDIELPIPDNDFWVGAPDSNAIFEVILINPNNVSDGYAMDNAKSVRFHRPISYEKQVGIEFRTNTKPEESSYVIKDRSGNIVLQRTNMAANTTYHDEFTFPNGCYTLTILDSGNDGLSFWANSGAGAGNASIARKLAGTTYQQLKIFNPDFGGGVQFDFTIAQPDATQNPDFLKFLSIGPNPTSDELHIQYQGHPTVKVHFRLLDLFGRVVDERIEQSTGGEILDIHWKLHTPVDGTYSLQILQNQQQIIRKVMFVH